MSGTILITGANGYLGSNCVDKYAGLADSQIVATWHSGSERLMKQAPPHVHYERCDLTDQAQVRALFQRWRIKTVIHTAALLPDGGTQYLGRAVQANVAATANLVQSAVEANCERLVYCSSISVYGKSACPEVGWKEVDPVAPSTSYGWSKYAGEECIRLCVDASPGFAAVSLRLAGIHGRGRRAGVLFHMTRAALAGDPLVVSQSAGRFQLLFLDDAVNAVQAAAQMPPSVSFDRINVASEVFSSLRQVADRVVRVCGSKSEIRITAMTGAGEQVMNTEWMKAYLRLSPALLETQVQEIRDTLERAESPHA